MNSNFESEYQAVREAGAGIIAFPKRGLIEVSGAEAVQFLNGLITNDVKKLADNSWMFAAFPNAQGRLLALVRVLRRGDRFLFDVDAANYAAILQNLTRFTFAGDFKVADSTETYRLISLQGANANEMLANSKFQIPDSRFQIVETEFEDEKIIVIESNYLSPRGFDLFVPAHQVETLTAAFKANGAVNIGDEVREVLRVEMGTPLYNVDMDEATIVLETGINEAVSFTKGCYIGQEIIARIHFRGHVAKQLSGLILEENTDVQPHDELKSPTGKAAGRITSTVFSPVLNKRIALAIVRYEFLAPDTELKVVRGEQELSSAKVVELPFVKS